MAFSLSSSHPLHAGQGLAADVQSLQNLKRDATQNDPAATKEAARQFESLFMREMIKSMREATMKSGLLDGAHGDLGTDMLDQQLSVQMSGQPGGLSEIIARQLAQATRGKFSQAEPRRWRALLISRWPPSQSANRISAARQVWS